MKFSIRHPKDFWSGVFFAVTGITAIVIARRYNFGTTAQMGPGFFPTLLGGLLIALGLVLSARGVNFHAGAERIPRLVLRPVLAVLGAVVLFALLLRPLGLVAASLLLVGVSSLGGDQFRKKEVVISALILTAFCVAVFSFGLKLDMPVWPAFLRS